MVENIIRFKRFCTATKKSPKTLEGRKTAKNRFFKTSKKLTFGTVVFAKKRKVMKKVEIQNVPENNIASAVRAF